MKTYTVGRQGYDFAMLELGLLLPDMHCPVMHYQSKGLQKMQLWDSIQIASVGLTQACPNNL